MIFPVSLDQKLHKFLQRQIRPASFRRRDVKARFARPEPNSQSFVFLGGLSEPFRRLRLEPFAQGLFSLYESVNFLYKKFRQFIAEMQVDIGFSLEIVRPRQKIIFQILDIGFVHPAFRIHVEIGRFRLAIPQQSLYHLPICRAERLLKFINQILA